MALQMKDACEKCGRGLVADGPAFICSYECTFCHDCTLDMGGQCPNCGGEQVPRPRRETPPSAA